MSRQGNLNNPFANTAGNVASTVIEQVTNAAMNPNAGGGTGNAMNDMAADMMKQYAMGQVRQKEEEIKGWLSFMSIDGLKIYFDVTNSYVLHKLKIILFPFLLKEDDWKRTMSNAYVVDDFA